ncbi:MAG: ribosome biogenesis GTPase Der [Peptococcaceae bacterium]|nr:ribosome biogenesis GTPase Der [Peptococcaceae bacterium]
MKPVVAIVGRANVGKSTLFNRLTHTRRAIVDDFAGVTRDRLYEDVTWNGKTFTLIDTGGIELKSNDEILKNVRFQAEIAIEEADVILYVVDVTTGVTTDDQEVAQMLRKSGKDVILVVNKVEQFDDLTDVYEFYSLGMDDLIPIAASHGTNTGDLLDLVHEHLTNLPATVEEDDERVHIAVVGRPNVGKSSLTNAIIGEDRSIVSDVAGTTRDAIDSTFVHNGEEMVIVDTAGMRKRGKIDMATERYSVMRALRAVDRCDVALFVINAEEGLIEQDKKVAGYVHEQGKGLIIVVNKWDLIDKDDKTMKLYTEKIKSQLLFMSYAPIIFVSALTGQRVGRIIDIVKAVAETRLMRLPTSLVNEIVRDAVLKNPPPTDKGKRLKIFYATQVDVAPPTFALFVNDAELMHFSYLRYLENCIRKHFAFEGTTIRLELRNKKEG